MIRFTAKRGGTTAVAAKITRVAVGTAIAAGLMASFTAATSANAATNKPLTGTGKTTSSRSVTFTAGSNAAHPDGLPFLCKASAFARTRNNTITYSGNTICDRPLYQDGQATLWPAPNFWPWPLDSAPKFQGVMATGSSVGIYRNGTRGNYYDVNYNIDVVAPPGDVWLSLPAECEGVGTWLATCGFNDYFRLP